MLKSVLVIIALELCACQTAVLDEPPVTWYGVKNKQVKRPGFFGVQYENLDEVYRPFSDTAMDGGQCLSAADFKKEQDWASELVKKAKGNCDE